MALRLLLAFSASSLTIVMEAAYFSEMSVNFYQIICPQIPEVTNPRPSYLSKK
jgi:hypothetical protein